MLRFLRIAIELLLVGALAWTSLVLGGTPSWTWTVLEIIAAVLVILWLVRMIVQRRLAWVKTPLNILLILLLAYLFFQLVPLPAGILRVFQSNTLRVYTVGPPEVEAAASVPLDVGGSFPVSLNRMRTRQYLLLWAAYVAFFLVLINNVRGRQQLGRMLGVLIALGSIVAIGGFATARQEERLFYRRWPAAGDGETPAILNADANPEFSAGYGFVFHVTEGDRVDFYVPKVHTGDVFADYPSSNSAATVMVMVLMLSLGVFFAYTATRRTEWGGSGGLLYTREGNVTMLVLFTAVLVLCGLGISRSRAGVGLVLVGLPLLIVLVAFSRSLLAGVITVAVILALLIVPMAVVGKTEAVDFISTQIGTWLNPSGEEVRLTARESAWRIVGDYPLFGTGLGTFSSVYPGYKIRGPMLYFVHCDPLQWFAETGLVGVILAGAVLVVGAGTALVGWFRLKDLFFKRLLLGCVLACGVFLGHGLLDFPLEIPGVVIFFVTVGALIVILSCDRVARNEEEDFLF